MQFPSFEFEQKYWNQDIQLIAGLDEVGMGAWAGPVCAAAVVFGRRNDQFPMTNDQIKDSKMLTAKQREKAAIWIKENSVAWAIGEASVEEIFELNILQAARLAMKRAIEKLSPEPEFLLVDGRSFQVHPTIPSEGIIKGDQKSFSIAAASILAKVHRDNFMIELGKQHPEYGFESHKGYGSKQHQEALKERGALACHRAAYAPIRSLA